MPTNGTLQDFVYVVLIVTIANTNNKPGYVTKSTCSGTLIREDIVLTAAHCFQDRRLIKEVKITMLTGIVRTAISLHIHPNFNQNGSDLAVLTCPSTELKTNLHLPAEQPNVYGKQSCFVAGFGGSDTKSKVFKAIYLNESSVISINDFIKLIFVGTTPCKGDSGGPLICGRTLYGVLSKGSVTSCSEKNSLTLYENVFHHLAWIQPILNTPINAAPTDYTVSIFLAAIVLIVVVALIYWYYIIFHKPNV